MTVTALDDQHEVRAVELDGHPFFVATLFEPEMRTPASPLVGAFVTACQRRHDQADEGRKLDFWHKLCQGKCVRSLLLIQASFPVAQLVPRGPRRAGVPDTEGVDHGPEF